jgi:predicted N-acyltransferase
VILVIDTKVLKTIDSIGREALDSLVNDGFFTYGWFKTLETSKLFNLNPFYVTAYDKGNLVAFAPCFHDVDDQYFRYGQNVIPYMKKVLNVCNRLHIGRDHVLLCYSPSCYRTKIFVGNGLNEGLLLKNLSEEIDAICKQEKILFSSFLFVSEFDQLLVTQLENLGYHKFFWQPTLYLDVRWRNFEDYLKSLDHNVRNRIRREIRSCKENGVTIEELTEFKHLSKVLSDLSSNNLTKHNKRETRVYEPSFFENLSDYAKGNAKVYVAKKNGAIVGFSLCLKKCGTLDVFHAGFNYVLQEKFDFTYFNLCYYSPINWAIQEGIQKIYYRVKAERVKIRRGCKPEKIYSFVKCHNNIINSQIGAYLKIRNKIGQV